MCLIAFHWQPQAAVPLIVAANRDEFYARPTRALHRWVEPAILAGQDLQAGGTWLGLSARGRGRLAALTNYRDPLNHRADAPSRGDITTAFLTSTLSAEAFLHQLAATAHTYNPFNLLLFDGTALWGFESRHRRALALPPGVSAVSNADFNTPWPKLTRLRTGMVAAAERYHLSTHGADSAGGESALLQLLSERRAAPDHQLPDTGIGQERERALSPEFIHTPGYGTRCSTLVWLGQQQATVLERSFDANGPTGEVRQQMTWDDIA